MAGVVLIGDPKVVVGFRLAGATARPVATLQDARGAVLDALARGEPGIVFFDDAVLDLLTEKERRAVEDAVRPILFPIPTARARAPARGDHRLADLLRSAIGHHVKIVR